MKIEITIQTEKKDKDCMPHWIRTIMTTLIKHLNADTNLGAEIESIKIDGVAINYK
jgi:hypothetical protein